MIDLKLFERILNSDVGLIEQSDFLTDDVLAFLSNYKGTKIRELFCINSSGVYKYDWEHKCSECGVIRAVSSSKTRVLEYIQSLSLVKEPRPENGKRSRSWDAAKGFLRCPTCRKKRDEERDAEWAEIRAGREAERLKATERFRTYIDPTQSWGEGTSLYHAFRHLVDEWGSFRDKSQIIAEIKDMKYADFLATPYWKAVANEVRRRAGFQCQLCKREGELHVHHRSYEHHGSEIEMIGKDLICLCSKCHETFHEVREVA